MKYEFYIRKSNEIIGPFTAKEISEMNLPEDTSIKEFHQEEWRCLKDYKLFIMLVKLETRDRCRDDMAIKRSLNLALGEFVLNKVKVDFSASELLSEEENAFDNMPENLQDSMRGQDSQDCLSIQFRGCLRTRN